VGGASPGFFLHSDGRVGIGNTAPGDKPTWAPSGSTEKNKLNVTGHTHITGSLNVTGHLYGDGSNLTGTALPWQQATSNPGTDIKYEGGRVGIGGEPSSTNILKVHGTVEATSFSGIQASDVPDLSANKITTDTLDAARIPTLSTSKISGLGTFATKNDGNYNIHDTWLRDNGDNAHVKLYGGTRQMTFRTDGTTEYASGIGGYPFAWMYGGDHSSQRRMLLNTSGQLWCSNYGWLHDKFAERHGNSGYNFSANASYVHEWLRFKSSGGIYWDSGSTGYGWHIYPADSSRMQLRANSNLCYLRLNGSGNAIYGSLFWQDSGGSKAVGLLNSSDQTRMYYTTQNQSYNNHLSGTWFFQADMVTKSIFADGLQVIDYTSAGSLADHQHDYWTNGGSILPWAGYAGYGNSYQYWSIVCSYGVKAQFMTVTSDERIKTQIEELDDSEALDKLRKLKPCKYHYKELLRQRPEKTIGFIAQEVEEILPNAVVDSTGVIPDLQRKGLIEIIDIEAKKLKLQMTDVGYDWPEGVGLKEGDVFSAGEEPNRTVWKFRVDTVVDADELIFLITCLDSYTSEFSEIKNWKHMTVMGHYVNDFKNLDKSMIFAVATAALQEVDRQLQAEKEKTKSLEDRMSILEEIISRNGLT
tara:strand:- start:3114 stop:5036 length:1923 start_codon:yes stop_codon:yes gene_type:complete